MTKKAPVKPVVDESVPSRRTFLRKVWLGLGGLALMEVIWLITSFLRPRRSRATAGSDDSVIVAGLTERFEKNSVTAFPRGKLYLARLEDGGFLALHRECTHLGCTVPWNADEQRFICPCHASAYDIKGNVLNPPAPRALDLFAVRIENGIVKIDTSRTLKRKSFAVDQVIRP